MNFNSKNINDMSEEEYKKWQNFLTTAEGEILVEHELNIKFLQKVNVKDAGVVENPMNDIVIKAQNTKALRSVTFDSSDIVSGVESRLSEFGIVLTEASQSAKVFNFRDMIKDMIMGGRP